MRSAKCDERQLEFDWIGIEHTADPDLQRSGPVSSASLHSSSFIPHPSSAPSVHPDPLTGQRAALRAAIEKHAGIPIALMITDNSSTIMSFKRERTGGAAVLRLHHMFLAAGPDVVQALAAWVRSPRSRKTGDLLDRFIAKHVHTIRTRPGRVIRTACKGRHFDLGALFEDINRTYFGNTVTAAITWGRMPAGRRRRSIRFGGYFPTEDLIRVHPLLDQDFVPEYFVRYIVFHEMLHAAVETDRSPAGRRRIHGRAYKDRERAYPDYARAVAWQNDPANLRKLLARPNSIRPVPNT